MFGLSKRARQATWIPEGQPHPTNPMLFWYGGAYRFHVYDWPRDEHGRHLLTYFQRHPSFTIFMVVVTNIIIIFFAMPMPPT